MPALTKRAAPPGEDSGWESARFVLCPCTFSLARRYGMLEKLAGRKVAERYGKHYPQTRNPQFTDHFDAMLQDAQCRQIYPAFTIEKSVQTRRDYIDSLTGSSSPGL